MDAGNQCRTLDSPALLVGAAIAAATPVHRYVRADGTRVPISASLNGPDGFADLSIPLAANGDTHLNLPWMSGGRSRGCVRDAGRMRSIWTGTS